MYSTRSTDKARLQDTLSDIIDHDISIRWMRINDGSGWQKDCNTSNDPRALHIECASAISRQVESKIRQLYSSKQTKFPLHTRLRFVPAFTKLLDLDSIAKFRLLANRQDGWSKQHMARSRDDIIEIDRKCSLDKTLRDLIMGIKAKDSKHPLFTSVDRKWNGQGYNFSFHPKKAIEANMALRGLFPRLAHEHGEANISSFFSPRAVSEGRYMKYDPEKQTVTTEADESILDLSQNDMDMVVDQKHIQSSLGERQVFEKERLDDDSVSTFQSKRAPPSEIATSHTKKARTSEEGSSTSSTSTLSATTKTSLAAFNTRISAIENEMKGFESRLASKFDLLICSLNINTNGKIITPTKTPTDGIAAQEGEDLEEPKGTSGHS